MFGFEVESAKLSAIKISQFPESNQRFCRIPVILSRLFRWSLAVDASDCHKLQVPGHGTHGTPRHCGHVVVVPAAIFRGHL
jgi:hypothetical protein